MELTEGLLKVMKETILAYEQLILQELEFDMIVEAPVAYNQMALLLKYIGRIRPEGEDEGALEPEGFIHTLTDLGIESLRNDVLVSIPS